ncbi:pirin family protein [Flavobacterium salilacus subsp. salilacus]|uniref:pirin family protein n=1 Tax=Flavobacterium TaxID=237 RepID=UPI001074E137|nr:MULTISPECIES: pirin family protein [Flavobacterium]KAF2518492.1 pirin family protein [Flavobacterium salilacus subsp. salilacus]MBE1615132.1 pirin family protein [Flavobacterium sp. SaA2.13]
MKSRLFPKSERGTADFGWLQANFSFSFGNYYNPDIVQFGMLRVLNDDTIAAGMGFGTHPHDNMEIITIPLQGGLTHRDSMGNEATVSFGEVQVMSAGTGIQHSEMNASKTEAAKTLQLWIFPDEQDVAPRYDQKGFDLEKNKNTFVNIVAPQGKDDNNALWIHQQAYLHLGIFDAGQQITYNVMIPGNGIYLFLIEGELEIDGQTVNERDAYGAIELEELTIEIKKSSKIVMIEVPMTHN